MKLKQKILDKLDKAFGKYGRYNSIRTDRLYRVLFFATVGAIFTAAFATYNGIFAIIYDSAWYGTFAVYLMILAIQRILVVIVYHKTDKTDEAALARKKLKIYLANGATFLPITLALSVIITLLINAEKPVISSEILAIMTAAYAFVNVSIAVYNFIKARRLKDPVIQTVRNSRLIGALVSLILLESTLITTFGTLTRDMFVLIAVSGLIVCLLALYIGVYMTVTGARRLKRSDIAHTDTPISPDP